MTDDTGISSSPVAVSDRTTITRVREQPLNPVVYQNCGHGPTIEMRHEPLGPAGGTDDRSVSGWSTSASNDEFLGAR
jgi:hypothetical protein